MTPRSPARDDTGSATLELVALAPALLTIVLLTVAAGRIAAAESQLEEAARDAARAASLERSPSTAASAARSAAMANTQRQSDCRGQPAISVSGDFTAPPGTSRSVRVTVTCSARLGDIALPGLPGSKVLTATYVAPIDTYRGSP